MSGEGPTLRERLDGPYAALIEVKDAEYSRNQLKSLESEVEEQRDREIGLCKKEAEYLKDELNTARKTLKNLPAWENRTRLHAHIAAMQNALRSKETECEPVLSLAFDVKLAKLRLINDWPPRREQVGRIIQEGRARDRKYGDVEDIGYRQFFEGQEKDIGVGEQAVRQMKSGGLMPGELQDAAVQDYVRRLAARIAVNSDLKVPLRVTVVDSPQIDVIALPGGFLFISSGLIEAAETESQLAGVLSHEIARIAARHGARASKRSGIASLFMQAAQVGTGLLTGGVTGAGAVYGINYGFQGLGALVDKSLIAANEKYQKEAAQLGIQYSWKAGFDPKGFIAFLDSITTVERWKSDTFFRTHPKLSERLVDLFAEIRFLPPAENHIVDSEDFRNTKERL